MINLININRPGYSNFVMPELTENTIILFSSVALKSKVTTAIEQIWLNPNNGDESVLFSELGRKIPEEDISKINMGTSDTTIVNLVGGQRFIFSANPAFVYAAKSWYDIWFVFEENGTIYLHALCEFIGSRENFEKGPDVIYQKLIQGNYGFLPEYLPANN